MDDNHPILGDLSADQFLAEYWQKKPLLIRNAFPNFEPPIEGDDLAGLSLEPTVESRLVAVSYTHLTLPTTPYV